jgi:hypothetical protein
LEPELPASDKRLQRCVEFLHPHSPAKFPCLKTDIVEVDNATSASSAVVNSSNPTILGVIQMKSGNCASKCISLVLGLRGIERVTEIHHTTIMHAHSRSWASTKRCPRS